MESENNKHTAPGGQVGLLLLVLLSPQGHPRNKQMRKKIHELA